MKVSYKGTFCEVSISDINGTVVVTLEPTSGAVIDFEGEELFIDDNLVLVVDDENGTTHNAYISRCIKKAFVEGWDVGESGGFYKGHSSGYSHGWEDGHKRGYNHGWDDGYNY